MPSSHPAAIDSRLVFRLYAAAAVPFGLITFLWPLLVPVSALSAAGTVRTRVVAAIILAFGCCAATFGGVDDAAGRRRALVGFAYAHLLMGVMLWTQAFSQPAGSFEGPSMSMTWVVLLAGSILLSLGLGGSRADLRFRLQTAPSPPPGVAGFAIRNKPSLVRLRTEYEVQIRNAARQEERARLARDLHDAVKQQLFVIQTAGAAAQARFDTDASGARAALDQVRTAAREAMTEMEAMLDQLQSAPISNAGLVAFLRKQCEALGFRTGAQVAFELGAMPDEAALDPGIRHAIARAAQEAISNVARHARASQVTVSLGEAAGALVLAVTDNGSGFVFQDRRSGMGMDSLAARAAETGGSLDVTSTPGRGTTVRFAVPSSADARASAHGQRAVIWLVAFLLGLASARLWPLEWRPLIVLAVLLAGIAAARYGVAAWRLRPTGA